MKLLLDTHAFLFAIAEPEKLSARVRKWLSDPAIPRSISAASFWEIAIKVQIGKLMLPLDRGFFLKQIEYLQATVVPVELRHCLALLALPFHHRDPFDRLLIAQALEDGFTLVTRDRAFGAYRVNTVW